MKIRQKSKLTKVGSSYGFIISKKLVDAQVLKPGKYYEYDLEEIENHQYIYPDNMRDSRIKAFIGEQCSVLA